MKNKIKVNFEGSQLDSTDFGDATTNLNHWFDDMMGDLSKRGIRVIGSFKLELIEVDEDDGQMEYETIIDNVRFNIDDGIDEEDMNNILKNITESYYLEDYSITSMENGSYSEMLNI